MNHHAGRRRAVPQRLIAGTLACVAVVCILAVIVAGFLGIDSRELFEDFQKIADVPFYTGAMSHLGVILWYSSVAISLFSAVVLRTRPWPALRGRPDVFLASWGLLGLVFATDDLLLVHERVAPAYLGVPEEAVMLSYAAVLGYLVLRWWLFVTRRTPAAILWFSLGCFGLSLLAEYSSAEQTPLSILWEDGLKLVGIAMWLLYFAIVGHSVLTANGGQSGDADFGLLIRSATVQPDDCSSGGQLAGFNNIADESRPAMSQAVTAELF